MNRRGFFASVLALAVAAKFRRKGPAKFDYGAPTVEPILWGDGHHDDTAAMQAWGSGRPWRHADGTPGGKVIANKRLMITMPIIVTAAAGDGLELRWNHIRVLGEADQRLKLQWVSVEA